MGLIKGKDLIIYKGSEPYACARNCTVTINAEMLETTSSSGGRFRSYIPKGIEWEISGDGLVKLGDSSVQSASDVFDDLINRTEVTLKLVGTDGTNTSQYQGNGYLQNLEITGGDNDVTNYSFSLKGTGQLTRS